MGRNRTIIKRPSGGYDKDSLAKIKNLSNIDNDPEALSFINLLDEREQIMLIGELKERIKGRSATQEKVG